MINVTEQHGGHKHPEDQFVGILGKFSVHEFHALEEIAQRHQEHNGRNSTQRKNKGIHKNISFLAILRHCCNAQRSQL